MLLVVLLLTAMLVFLPFQRSGVRRVNLGTVEAASLISGFSFPETDAGGQAFRWSEATGTVRFANVANQPLTLTVYFDALRASQAPTVTVSVNGQPAASIAAGGAFAEHSIALPRSRVGWNGDVVVRISAPTFTAPPDPRQLGARVAWLQIAPAKGLAIPSAPVLGHLLLPLMLAVLGIFWFGRRFGVAVVVVAPVAVAVVAAVRWLAADTVVASRMVWLLPIAILVAGAAVAWAPATMAQGGRVVALPEKGSPGWLLAHAYGAGCGSHLPAAGPDGGLLGRY